MSKKLNGKNYIVQENINCKKCKILVVGELVSQQISGQQLALVINIKTNIFGMYKPKKIKRLKKLKMYTNFQQEMKKDLQIKELKIN